MRFTTAGQAVTRISLATDRPSRSGGESGTDWHQITCWGNLAEFAGQHLAKGRLIFVAGRLVLPDLGRPRRAAPARRRGDGDRDHLARSPTFLGPVR